MYWMVANTKFLKDTALYTTLPILNNETIGEYLFVAPTNKCEQKEIADYLDQKCAEIDTLIAKKTALLEEMETYKKSVIYEYVTGKKEVL
jgi:type I restriction enzyme S subunit